MESALFSHTVGLHLLKKLNKLIIFQKKKKKKQRKHQAQMSSLVNSTKHFRKKKKSYLQSLPENRSIGNTF